MIATIISVTPTDMYESGKAGRKNPIKTKATPSGIDMANAINRSFLASKGHLSGELRRILLWIIKLKPKTAIDKPIDANSTTIITPLP